MKISEIASILNGTILCCEEISGEEVFSACGSDMMSDVLAYVKNQAVLLTGLVNPQVIRTAEMMDMKCVVFVRNKAPSDEILAIARQSGIAVIKTAYRMYEACGMLYAGGLTGKAGE
ncbi:MAG: DRTGG domain-containing protein [Eubacteriales bacterium]|nr:DRTGG domain-containing protein [Eubacteriales bacterium]